MQTLTITVTLSPETLARLRRVYPVELLRRAQAEQLWADMGLGRRGFEALCKENPPGFRRKIGQCRQHRYSREALLRLAQEDTDTQHPNL